MLALTKRTEYGLIALHHLAQRPDKVISAREISKAYGMPQTLVMNILKTLAANGWLRGTRGSSGGYALSCDLSRKSIFDLIMTLEGSQQLADCLVAQMHGRAHSDCKVAGACPIQSPVMALHHRLLGFFKEVRLSEFLHRKPAPVEVPTTVQVGVLTSA